MQKATMNLSVLKFILGSKRTKPFNGVTLASLSTDDSDKNLSYREKGQIGSDIFLNNILK